MTAETLPIADRIAPMDKLGEDSAANANNYILLIISFGRSTILLHFSELFVIIAKRTITPEIRVARFACRASPRGPCLVGARPRRRFETESAEQVTQLVIGAATY